MLKKTADLVREGIPYRQDEMLAHMKISERTLDLDFARAICPWSFWLESWGFYFWWVQLARGRDVIHWLMDSPSPLSLPWYANKTLVNLSSIKKHCFQRNLCIIWETLRGAFRKKSLWWICFGFLPKFVWMSILNFHISFWKFLISFRLFLFSSEFCRIS